MRILRILGCIGLLVMCGCGGGGGTGATIGTILPTKPTKAVITVSIPPTLPTGTKIQAVSFKIKLPPGVTPAVLNANDASGSLSLVGGAATGGFSGASFDSATNTITFGNINLNAFGSGDFLVINCLLGSNTTATASDFTLLEPTVIDTAGGNAGGVIPAIAVAFQ